MYELFANETMHDCPATNAVLDPEAENAAPKIVIGMRPSVGQLVVRNPTSVHPETRATAGTGEGKLSRSVDCVVWPAMAKINIEITHRRNTYLRQSRGNAYSHR